MSRRNDLGPWTLDLGLESASIQAAVDIVRRRWDCPTTTAVILGSGLGDLADEITAEATIPYGEVPGFARSTALAHKGRLVCGQLDGVPIVMLQGRCHLYEGYSLAQVTLPVRVLAALGIQTLILTNAAGGLNPRFAVGDVMRIESHIDLMGVGRASQPIAGRPSRHDGERADGLGSPSYRTPHLYDRGLAAAADGIARRAGFPLHPGVYVGVTGPTYETRAEYRAFRRIGGDAVGMSTIPEALAAAACGLRVLALSTITNVASPDAPRKVSAQEVVEVSHTALPKVKQILRGTVAHAVC